MALAHVNFFSNTLHKCVGMDVILPQKTSGQIGMESASSATFPTLYLLHGMSDDQTIWQRRTSIERYVSDLGAAVVMPTTDLGWYTDMECGYQRYYTFIAKELPQICRTFFRGMSADRELNWVAGLSMGGYGALKIALKESDSFSRAACLSAAFRPELHPDEPYWNSIFGRGEEREKHTVRAMLDELLASGREKPEVFIRCGTEDRLIDCNRETRDELLANGFKVEYSEASGYHSWEFWDDGIKLALDWFMRK